MNEHLPPPRRPIPHHERSAMRHRIRQATGPAPSPSARSRSRLLAPAVAAAATLAVVAVGGYASLRGNDGSRGSGFASDGSTPSDTNEQVAQECPQGTLVPGPDGGWRDVERSGSGRGSIDAVPERESPPLDEDADEPQDELGQASGDPSDEEGGAFGCGGEVMVEAAPPTATVVRRPGPAYAECDRLVAERFPETGATTGRLAIEDGPRMTIVVTADSTTYVCNVGPDGKQVATAEDDVQVSGQHIWSGGRVQDGVTSMGVSFEDGPGHSAVMEDGWWALLAHQEEPVTGPPMHWAEVSESGDGVSGSAELCDEGPDC